MDYWLNGKELKTSALSAYCPWAVGLSLGMLNYGKVFRCELPLVLGVIRCDDSCYFAAYFRFGEPPFSLLQVNYA